MTLVLTVPQAECQGADEEDHLPGEEGVAEYDSFLEESAGGILGPLAALAGGELFLSKFDPILPHLIKKLVSPVAYSSMVTSGDAVLYTEWS